LQRLRAVESPNVTFAAPDFPVVWKRAEAASVQDVDGNVYLDATSAFGVAFVGHRHPAVVAAVAAQNAELVHGMGDVHPPAVRIALLERLDAIAPADLGHGVLCTGGSEAVEVAIKTALLATSKPGIISFVGGYHGLSTGALLATARQDFRAPFAAHLPPHQHLAPFPAAVAGDARAEADAVGAALAEVERLLADAAVGLVMVEPVQGRGGSVVSGAGFLPGLRALCDRHDALLCCDEIFTGCGRTGRWFGVDHEAVTPDLMCLGKALGGGWPISACVGRPDVMAAWGPSRGEALHTSTFLGHPPACAAAIATLEVIDEQGLVARADTVGERLRADLRRELAAHPAVGHIRGRGLMIGVEMRAMGDVPASLLAWQTVTAALRRGLVLLPSGPGGTVIQLTPPAIITDAQREAMVGILVEALHAAARGVPTEALA